MRILMISAEYAPFAKTGGLADMVTGLSKALARAGHDVRVIVPLYSGHAVDAADRQPAAGIAVTGIQVSPVILDGAHPGYTLLQVPASGKPEPVLYQLDAPAFFGAGAIYGGGESEARRFALLAHGALRLCEETDWSPDIIHCHDWHAALVPVLLKNGYLNRRVFRQSNSILTIHNIGYQGVFPLALANEIGLTAAPDAADVNFLRDGIAAADALTTVSPTHAAEILTPEYGKGLDPLLRQRRNRLVGILNGVDYDAWNPATDTRLPAHYDSHDLRGKRACREALIARAGLRPARPGPVLGVVTRLAGQKGIELIIDALPALLRQERVQMVILGQGEARYVNRLAQMTADFPDCFQYFDAQDESLARLIFAGSDAILVPSIYEPCGLTQLYAMRYGAVPVVRETGGLRDTVQHFDPARGTGTGSVFKHPDGAGLAWAIGEVLRWYGAPE
jgi:starch synthase